MRLSQFGRLRVGDATWRLRPSRSQSGTTYGSRDEQERRRRIGRATEDALNFTRTFLSTRPHEPPTLHPAIQLCIRNSPEEVLLSVQGAQMYVRVARVLRWTLRTWYGLRYRELQIVVVPMGARPAAEKTGGEHLRIKWTIEGRRRRGWMARMLFGGEEEEEERGRQRGSSSNTAIGMKMPGRQTLLTGYSVYEFHPSMGDVTYHLVDRIVPPTMRGNWLWWYLERIVLGGGAMAGGPAKPLVGTTRADGGQRRL